jgi:hypothetical protein
MGRDMKKRKNIGSTFDSWLREEGLLEEVSAKAAGRVIARHNAAAMAQQGLTESKIAKTCKSKALAALHENVSDLYRAGGIDKQTMRKFDAACVVPARKPTRTASK